MSTPMEERMDLIERIPDEPARPEEFILQELMTIAVAREVRNDDIVFAGTGLPMLGIMTAHLLNAPHALLIYESGVCDGKTMHIPMSVCDQRAAYMSSALGGLVDTFGYYLQQGFVTLGFLSGAAIDRYGGINVTAIGENYYAPVHRLPGAGGNPDVGTMARRTVYIIPQERRRFLDRNDYTTTPGWWCRDFDTGAWRPKREIWKGTPFAECGPAGVVTNMGVYRFDDDGIIYLDTHHPGVTLERIREQCGFDLNCARLAGETPHPTYRELFVLREFVDPELIFLPETRPYPPAIQALIDRP
ncbi:MAG TPA: CoA-transferase [Syntrophales bacterium]|nr:CoA-transferase [Syntrophales bacterium]